MLLLFSLGKEDVFETKNKEYIKNNNLSALYSYQFPSSALKIYPLQL